MVVACSNRSPEPPFCRPSQRAVVGTSCRCVSRCRQPPNRRTVDAMRLLRDVLAISWNAVRFVGHIIRVLVTGHRPDAVVIHDSVDESFFAVGEGDPPASGG